MIIYRWASAETAPGVIFPDLTAFDALLKEKSFYTYVVDLRAVTAEAMAAINLQYRHVNESTDILSFPLYQSIETLPAHDAPLGDLVICSAMMDAEHLTNDTIIVHGVLHLLGFDHESDPKRWATALKQVTVNHAPTAA